MRHSVLSNCAVEQGVGDLVPDRADSGLYLVLCYLHPVCEGLHQVVPEVVPQQGQEGRGELIDRRILNCIIALSLSLNCFAYKGGLLARSTSAHSLPLVVLSDRCV